MAGYTQRRYIIYITNKANKHMTTSTNYNQLRIAYLTAYLPDGTTMEYRTGSYEDVYKFKRVCEEKGIDHAVRFKKVTKQDEAHIRRGGRNTLRGIYTRVRRFLFARMF